MKVLGFKHKSVLSLTILFLLFGATIGSLLTIFPIVTRVEAQPTILGVFPTLPAPKNPGEFLTVLVNITAVTDLYTWGFKLKWKQGNFLDCIGVQEETGFFDGDFGRTIDNSKDEVSVGSTFIGAVPGETGSGRLARIRFEVKDGGNCTLDLFNTSLRNSTGGAISHIVEDGTFYTTFPKAQFTFSPNPREYPEDYGHPIVNETVTFNATTSYDPDQSYKGQTGTGIIDYQWAFGDGSVGSGSVATHAYDTAGTYSVTLTVMDDDFEMDDETYPIEGLRIKLHAINVTDVTIINDPPSVDVGGMVYVNATVQNYGSDPVFLNVTLYATAGVNTYAVNTTIFNYLEYLGLPPPPPPPGPGWVVRTELKAGETQTVTIFWDTTGLQEGNYTMSVKAFLVTPPTYIPPLEHRPDLEPDISDNEISDGEVRITPLSIPEHNLAVTTINVDPTDLEIPLKPTDPSEWANAEVTVKNIGNLKDRFNLTLTAYHDSSVFDSKSWWNQTLNPGLTRTFGWQFLKGTDDTEEGNYNLTATVLIVNATTLEEIPDQNTTDNTISEIFEIRLIPFASFTYSPLSPVVDQEVTFSASASYAPGADGGTIETYTWDFGDSSPVVESPDPVATHAYNRSGIFTATLTVTDDIGLTKKLSHTFYVAEKHDITITDVSFSPQKVSTGGAIDITVAIQNTGGFQETFNVTVYYDQQEITTQTDITLAADANTTLYFTWTTLGVAGGDYEIKASATDVDEEIHTEDNVLVGGTVTIEKLSSTITVSAFPTTLTIGETVTINGTLSPVRAGVEVAIWYILNGGTSTLLANVTTNANGVYTHPWTPSEVGSYELRSSWLGDDLTLPSESAPQNLVVQEASSDIFLYIVGALAAVGVALLVYFVWFRRPKIPQKKPSE